MGDGMPPAFYLPAEDGLVASPATRGPWTDRQQHGGPVAALLARALEAVAPDGGHLARISVDFLSPVPVGTVATQARVLRPGRSVALLEADLLHAGEVLARATAWWRREAADLVPEVALGGPELPAPETLETVVPDTDLSRALYRGYIAAVEWRYAGGRIEEPGPSTARTRPRVPLVAGEATTPTQRAMLTADSASGISAALDFRTHLFSNIDLTVHLLRPPTGDWVSLHAVTALAPAGGGLATGVLGDLRGPFAHTAQTLFVRPHARSWQAVAPGQPAG